MIRRLAQALQAPGSSPLPRAILDLPMSEDNVGVLKQALHNLLIDTTVLKAFNSPKEFNFKDVEALYFESLRSTASEYVVDTLNYLRLYQALAMHLRRLELGGSWFSTDIPADAQSIIAALENIEDFRPELMSSKLVLGKLWALQDRSVARELFKDGTIDREKDLGVFHHDCGATTYFDDTHLEQQRLTTDKRHDSLPARQQRGPINLDGARFFVVMSCEQKYMRMYLPYWLSVAEYLRPHGFAYHFLLADSTDEATTLIDNAAMLSDAIARFRGYDPRTFCSNISFSSIPIPSWCPNLSSFAACARLLYARDIAESTGMRVITQDIDFCITHNPLPWFSALPSDKVALTPNRVIWTVDPWRKFLGGTYVLPHGEPGFALARKVESYLLAGLSTQTSWYLDQNALAYLYEVEEGTASNTLCSLAELGSLIRPSNGLDIHYMFKQLQKPV